MELQLAFSGTTSTIIFLVITIFFLLSLIKLLYKRSQLAKINLPPGPWKLPIIGSIHHLATSELPYHTLSKLSKRHGPLMHLQLCEISAVVVSSPQMAKLFMKTHDLAFGGRASTLATDVMSYDKSEIVFAPCGDHWQRMRKEMFMGGTETSTSVMEWAMCEMIKNPIVMEKAQSEVRRLSLSVIKDVKESDIQGLNYLNLVIKETLRLHPPGPLLGHRECTEPCEINGYNIAAKTKVIVNTWAIGRDPEFWEDAEKFIPERFEKHMLEYNRNNFEYIPFGAGKRICPGVSFALAMVEQELVLAQLLYHYNWKLPNQVKPEELDMNETFGISAKRRNPLTLIADFNETTLIES